MAEQLFDDFWQWRLKDSPELATMVGMHEYDDQLESYSLQSYNQRKVSVFQHFTTLKCLAGSNDVGLVKIGVTNKSLFSI